MSAASEKVTSVQLDGLVLLKIIKHCREYTPNVVTGQLLGLDMDGKLEITNCFATPEDAEDEGYQMEMMMCLRKVNVEVNTVGWYQSTFHGSFLTPSVIKAQYDYQVKIPSSVVIAYEPLRTTAGRLALKAYRLSSRFMRLYAKGDFSSEGFMKAGCDSRNIFEEIPIKVHNSHLVHGFLYELREAKSMSAHLDRLHISPHSSLEKNLTLLSSAIEEYAQEQNNYQFQQRQRARQKQQLAAKRAAANEKRQRSGMEPLPDEDFSQLEMPSRLETFLISKQISEYSQAIISTAMQGFNKYYAAEALQRRDDEDATPVSEHKGRGGKHSS